MPHGGDGQGSGFALRRDKGMPDLLGACRACGLEWDRRPACISVRQISKVERPRPNHFQWPGLDIDLMLDMIADAAFPLCFRGELTLYGAYGG